MSSRGQMANNHAEKWGETGWKVGGRGAWHTASVATQSIHKQSAPAPQ